MAVPFRILPLHCMEFIRNTLLTENGLGKKFPHPSGLPLRAEIVQKVLCTRGRPSVEACRLRWIEDGPAGRVHGELVAGQKEWIRHNTSGAPVSEKGVYRSQSAIATDHASDSIP
jgi:hypothetical protein